MVADSGAITLELATPEEAGLRAEQLDRIRERAPEWVAAGRGKSLVLLAARKGRIALYESYGVQSFDDSSALVPESMFACASVAKVVTATAIMLLVERGEMSLNRPLREYIPEMSGRYSERILVHHLLTHTSGFADIHAPPLFVRPPETDVPCPDDLYPHMHKQLQAIYAQDCHKKPGEQNMYCTENFILLGELIRRVTGEHFDVFVREHIFAPLSMTHSTFGAFETIDVPELAISRRDPAEFPFPELREAFQNTPVAGGSLKSNAMDLARFGQTFANGGAYGSHRLLGRATVAEMVRNQIPGKPTVNLLGTWIPEASWGLGWMVQGDERWPWSHGALQPPGTFYHQGASGCALWVDPVNDVVGVYMSVLDRDMRDPDPGWEFDRFQNMVTGAVV